ncbi:pyridoxamine 5'-phosphate oxidase family protein [Streptomyces sp. NBC_01803]|uniref:pyridoxamine 5'-phosphate oxidase family protein n=1 Tax=Streptomyces sp. NBC_01803 TaxID=2975946 RepID=UPI002DD9519E|nr:pyridoxamine 5'-phosphate oxidase family protein [Streptomyces sp. NBC_01803]WSA45218.1 pyridoxamine 5'-phosphate oxidase family protein [Streptomyces sp. NBC_01803]
MPGHPTPDDQLTQLTHALRLLPRVPHGHAAVTWRALPRIVPACHLVTGDRVLLRVPTGQAGARVLDGSVVAYEANNHGGDGPPWGAQLIGTATLADPDASERAAFPAPPAHERQPESAYLRLIPRFASVRDATRS